MHPLLALLALRPQLLMDHAQAYATLFGEEWELACTVWRRWALLQAVALCFLGVAATLAGVGLMLWAVTPPTQIPAPWVLFAVPIMPLAMALVCTLMANRLTRADAFENLGRQLNADLAMLRSENIL
jgi:hypothetical protein